MFLLAAVAAAAAGAGIAVAASGGSGSPPPPKVLPAAVQDALGASPVAGVSGNIAFTNRLVDAGSLGSAGSSPLVAGATGRFWVTADGHARIELKSSDGTGDVQVLYDGSGVELYDGATNTVYKAQLPVPPANPGDAQAPPSLSEIQAGLDKLAGAFTLSGAIPTTVAGQGAYQLRLTPTANGGLLGAAEIAWDAVHGIPLRMALYAAGDSTPVLELTATQITYGTVASSDVQITFPSNAHVVDLGTLGGSGSGSTDTAPVTGVAAVSAQLAFPLVAPDALGGQPRTEVRLVHMDGSPAALVTYGQGLGSLVVLEGQKGAQAGSGGLASSLPTVSIASGLTARELPTALGTVLRFEKGGVSFTVAASQPAATVVAAARSIAG